MNDTQVTKPRELGIAINSLESIVSDLDCLIAEIKGPQSEAEEPYERPGTLLGDTLLGVLDEGPGEITARVEQARVRIQEMREMLFTGEKDVSSIVPVKKADL